MFGSKFHPLRVMSGAAGKDIYNGGGKGGSAPPPPDYAGAAAATAAGNLEAARATAAANRINQYTPYGSLTYTQTPTQTLDTTAYNKAIDAYKTALTKYNNLTPAQKAKTTAPKAPSSSDYMTYNPDAGWTATQTLSPEQQRIADQTAALNSGLLGTAQSGLNYANKLLSQPGVDTSKLAALQSNVPTEDLANSYDVQNAQNTFDVSNLPSYGINPGESYSDAIMRRLQPQMAADKQAFDAKMANQGVVPGTQAYDAAYRNFAQGQNDQLTSAVVGGMQTGLAANQQAYNQALGLGQFYNQAAAQNTNNAAQLAAFRNAAAQQQFGQGLSNANLANAARQQGFQEQAYNQMQPINVINALRSGTQVTNPNFVNSAQQPATQGADILGATNAQYQNQLNAYNAQQAAAGGFMGGLMNLGGTLGAAKIIGSDRSIKENIIEIGKLHNGLNLYKYNYKQEYRDTWGHGQQVGVMADEVEKLMPEAVSMHNDGYKVVNYSMLGA